MNDQETFDAATAYLAHYGVKGMHWGERKATIKAARRAKKGFRRELKSAKQEFVNARATGNAKKVADATKNLNETYKAKTANKRTAQTLTRGHQVALALLVTPVAAGLAIGGNAYSTRDSKPLKDYPVSRLRFKKATA
jgi:hypothetical protein